MAIRLRDGSITELNVWDRTGTIVYSRRDRRTSGSACRSPTRSPQPSTQGTVTSDVTTEPETGPIPGAADRLVEVYAPLRLPGQPPLAFEIYLRYDRVESTANNLVCASCRWPSARCCCCS